MLFLDLKGGGQRGSGVCVMKLKSRSWKTGNGILDMKAVGDTAYEGKGNKPQEES